MLNKKICFISSDQSGCYLYRIKHIADFLKQDYCVMFPFAKISNERFTIKEPAILNADIIVIQRHMDEVFLSVIPDLQSMGKKVVYDIDDILWEIPSSNGAHHAFNSKSLKRIGNIISLCDYVTVSTVPLMEYIKKHFNKNVAVVPNMLPDVFEIKPKTDRIRIGFVGSNTHKGDFSFHLCQALRDIKKNFDNVDLVFMGYNPVPGTDIEWHQFCPVEEYFEKLNSLNLDIGICPLKDDEFNKSKSNIKFLEYSACNVAVIASKVYPFDETILDDRTGSIIDNEKDWYKKIKYLVIDKLVRESMAKYGRDYVKRHVTYEGNGDLILKTWQKIIEEMYDIK